MLFTNWKEGMEKKGLRMNAGKTKIMGCRLSMGQAEDSGEPPCGVHTKSSGISGKLKSNVDFHCSWNVFPSSAIWATRLGWERGGESSKGQNEMCLSKVQGVVSYPDGPGCILPHKGKDIQGSCPECPVLLRLA